MIGRKLCTARARESERERRRLCGERSLGGYTVCVRRVREKGNAGAGWRAHEPSRKGCGAGKARLLGFARRFAYRFSQAGTVSYGAGGERTPAHGFALISPWEVSTTLARWMQLKRAAVSRHADAGFGSARTARNYRRYNSPVYVYICIQGKKRALRRFLSSEGRDFSENGASQLGDRVSGYVTRP